MKKSILFFALTLLFVYASCSLIPSSPEKLGLKELSFKPKQPQSWTLANGLKVVYLHNDEVPVVKGSLYLQGGSLWDPAGLAGLSSATGAALREGGTRSLSPDALDLKLANLAADIETDFSGEFSSVSFFSLEENISEVFDIFSEMIRYPRFDSKRFSLWKELSKNAILNRSDSPETMASMSFNQLIYGKDSPYGRFTTLNSLDKINVARVKEFYKNSLGPKNAILAISGSSSKEEIEKLVYTKFASWSGPNKTFSKLPSLDSELKPGIYVLEKNVPQSVILLGHRGPKRLTKDWYALQIFNRIYGQGGFESKLFNRIRTKLGLAYSVYGGFSPAREVGKFQVYSATRNEQVKKTVTEILSITSNLKIEKQKESSVELAKVSEMKKFVFKFSTPESLVERETLLELLSFPGNYNQEYINNIKKVKARDVDDIATKYLKDDLVIVIVGGISIDEIKEMVKENENINLPVYKLGFKTTPYLIDQVM